MSAQMQLGDCKQRYKDLASFEKEKVIQVGGRLNHALSYSKNHPVLLKVEHITFKLVVKDAQNHIRHAGRERILLRNPNKVFDSSRKKHSETSCQELRNLSQPPTISSHNVDGRPTIGKTEGLFSPSSDVGTRWQLCSRK